MSRIKGFPGWPLLALMLAACAVEVPIEDPLESPDVKALATPESKPLLFKVAVAPPLLMTVAKPVEAEPTDAEGVASEPEPAAGEEEAKSARASRQKTEPESSTLAEESSEKVSRYAGVAGAKATAIVMPDPVKLQQDLTYNIQRLGLFYGVEAIKPFEESADAAQQRDKTLKFADELGVDLVLVPRIVRHDVSYLEPSGWWVPSTIMWLLFIWPEFWFPDERWEATVEVEWELIYLRSGETIWGPSRYAGRFDETFNDFQRGFELLGPWGIPYLTHTDMFGIEERNFNVVSGVLMPNAVARSQAAFFADLGTYLRKVPIEAKGVSPQTYALVIGCDGPEAGGVKKLQFAKNDAITFIEYLSDPLGGAVDFKNVTKLLGQDAAVAKAREFLTVTVPKLGKRDKIIIYFAGYGATDAEGKGYLTFADTNPGDLAKTALSLDEVAKALETTAVENALVVLDTGFGEYPNGRTLLGTAARKALDRGSLQKLAVRAGHFLLTACDAGESALEWESGSHGLFTLVLLDALENADLDKDPERVSLKEAYDQVLDRVPPSSSMLGHRQEPLFFGATGEAEQRIMTDRTREKK